MGRTIKRALEPVGFQEMSLENSTAIAVNSTIAGSQFIIFSVETNDVRMRETTVPALTTGVLFKKDLAPYEWDGFTGNSMTFQRATGTAKVSIQGYKYAGAK